MSNPGRGRLLRAKGLLFLPVRLALRRLGLIRTSRVYYLVPQADWSNDWDGYYITSNVARQFGLTARITSRSRGLVGQIIHHSSLWSFLRLRGAPAHRRNAVVATVFHGSRSERFPDLKKALEEFLEAQDEVDTLVASCRIMERRFLEWGVPPSKIRRIPLGVDLSLFRPVDREERRGWRRKVGIPDDAFCIGSFQKDGNGWGEGKTPKLIKGPDLFLEVIKRLKTQLKVFVCLSGPARGYVKQGLEKLGVEYYHRSYKDYSDVAGLYHCLDSYLVTSREEGGPKGVLESLASGIPLVSTRVGLAPDVIEPDFNGLLAEQEDIDSLAGALVAIREDPSLARRLIRNGLERIKDYDWPLIAARYYKEVYEPLLGQAKRN